MDEPFIPRPAEFKTRVDGRGGLIRVTLVGEPHDGHELYIDELDLPAELWTSGAGRPFEWWPPAVQPTMAATATGQDPAGPAGPLRPARPGRHRRTAVPQRHRGALSRSGAGVRR